MSKNIPLLGFAIAGYTEIDYFNKFELVKKIGCQTIEIHLHDIDSMYLFKNLRKLKRVLADFKKISLHAPAQKELYINSRLSIKNLDQLDRLINLLEPHIVVIHPDSITTPSLITKRVWPLGLENMDWRKKTGRFVHELEDIFDVFPQSAMVLDLNHTYTLDPSMALAKDLWDRFEDKIRHFHISAFKGEGNYHEPFSQSDCNIILQTLPTMRYPLIIEVFISRLTDSEIEKEYVYVQGYLKQLSLGG